jgi:Gamma-glutamyl cyclotransferase, AIG2-like
MTAYFFACGTLMCEGTLLAATGCRFTGVRGFLRGFERRTIRGEVYPGILVTPGKVVEGLVYSDLPEVTWRRLDTFESQMYQRRVV